MFALTTGMGVKTGGTHNAMTKKDAKCFNFDGVDEYVNTTITGSELMANNAFTIAAWVRKDGAGSDFICGSDDGATDLIQFYIASGKLTLHIQSNSGAYATSAMASNVPGYGSGESDWFFAACKYVPSFITGIPYVSLNGSTWTDASLTNNTVINGNFSNSKNIWLGARNDDDVFANGFSGKISSIMFFDKALSQSELNDLYSMGNVGEVHPKYAALESDLLAWYRMGDDDSDSLNPNFADDDCSSDRTSDWATGNAGLSLTYNSGVYEVAATDAHQERGLLIKNITLGDYIEVTVKLKGDVGGETIRLFAQDDIDNIISSYLKTVTTSFEEYSILFPWTSGAFGYVPGTTGYVGFKSSGSVTGIEMKDFKAVAATAGGNPIGSASLTDASANSNTGTPTNMEMGDIVEDSPA